jgi:hypothetical protein
VGAANIIDDSLSFARIWRWPMNPSFTRKMAQAGLLSASVAALAVAFPSGAQAGLIESYAVSLTGSTGPIGPCTTYGPPAVEASMFSGGSGVGLPGNGTAAGIAACGAAAMIDSHSGASGVQSSAESLPLTTFGNPNFTNSFSGNAKALADPLIQQLRAAAHGAASSSDNAFNSPTDTWGSESIAAIDQMLTFHRAGTPDGTAATLKIGFGLNGSASLSGSGGFVSTQLRYAVNGVGPFPFFDPSLNTSDGDISVANNGATQQVKPPAGYASSTSFGFGFYSGSGSYLTLDIPIVLGTPFDFKVALMTDVLPGHDATADNNFFTTATLNATLLSIGGNQVFDFTGTSDTGALLGPNGVIPQTPTAVPEPTTLLLLVPALAALARRRQVRPHA